MSETLSVRHLDGDRFSIEIRGHTVTVDQPVADGGRDTAPTPTELFVAGLAGCVAFYARRYCTRHGIDPAGLHVEASFAIGGRPARVTHIAVHVVPPRALPAQRHEAFRAVVSHCTVHNSLAEPPDTEVVLVTDNG